MFPSTTFSLSLSLSLSLIHFLSPPPKIHRQPVAPFETDSCAPFPLVHSVSHEPPTDQHNSTMPLSADTPDDLAFFRHFFEGGELHVDETDFNGLRTQLHNAAYNNCLRIAEYLLRKNADASLVAEKGYTPLHIAAVRGHDYMVGLILKYSSRERVRNFIDMKSMNGSTALHLAARKNRYEAVRLLLSYGANFELKDKREKMPIEVTTREEVRRLLGSTGEMSRAAIEAKYDSLSALRLRLVMLPHLEYLATSMARNHRGYTPLQVAIDSMHLPTINTIAEIRLQRLEPDTALPGSVKSLADDLNSKWVNGIKRHLGTLRNEGLSRREALREGSHALLNVWLATRCFDKYRRELKEPLEEPNVKMIEEVLEVMQFDPRHFAAEYKEGEDAERWETRAQGTRYYELLNSRNTEDREAFMDVFDMVIVVPISLLQKSINSSNLLAAVKEDDASAARKATAASLLVDVNISDADERRPLHVAASMGNLKMLEFLLAEKADMTIATEKTGETPLHVAVMEGHLDIVEALLYNCDVDKVNDYVNTKTKSTGATALHLAVKGNRLDIVWCLMEHHAIYCMKDKRGKQPRELSKDDNVTKLFKFIDEAFDDAKNGRIEIVKKFEDLDRDLLLAVGNVCDEEGHSVPQVASLNKHRNIGAQIFRMVVEAKRNKNREFFRE